MLEITVSLSPNVAIPALSCPVGIQLNKLQSKLSPELKQPLLTYYVYMHSLVELSSLLHLAVEPDHLIHLATKVCRSLGGSCGT